MKNLYILLICLVTLSACNREEWLDVKPKGVVIPEKTGDYRLLLDQILSRSISPGFAGSYANTDFMADNFVITPSVVNFLSNAEQAMYTWSDNTFEPNMEDRDWATLYGQIYVTNVVAEEIMEATGTLKEKLQLEAEAKVQNAYAYFSLVNLYAVHYNASTASTIKAVPFRNTSAIVDVELPRATVQELYDHVLENLTSAIDFLPELPETNTHKHRPTKSSVYAFLARVHLYMGNYKEAKDFATKALNLNSTLLDYNTLPDVFGVISIPKQQDNPEIIWLKQSIETFRTLIVEPEFYKLYDDADQRKRKFGDLAFIFGIPGDDVIFSYPFFSNYRFTGFSVPEMLLIRAESNAREGMLSSAINDINTLRKNRIAPSSYTPLSATNKEEVIDLVLLQRRLEMVAEGQRFFDLKRLNEFENANISITHTLDGKSTTLLPGSKNWAVPVAQKYILETPEIGENDRD